MARQTINNLLDELSRKAGITEVIINRPDNVYVEKDGELIRLDTTFTDEEIEAFCQEIARFNRKEFDPEHPILDGSLPDGSRINLIHKDYTRSSHAVTIRKFLKSIRSFDTSPGIFNLNPHWVAFLKLLIRAKTNIVVSGGTGVGKTTFLNLLLQELNPRERVITIEDTRELQFNLPNVVRLEARPPIGNQQGLSIRDLLRNTLRMRPDRIIVGEVRGGECFDLLQAMNTGHEGSMTSVHANSPGECLMRLENLFMLSGYDIPIKALRHQISTAMDFIIQIKRDKTGARVAFQLTEVAGMEGDRILMQDIGVMKNGELRFTGLVPSCMPKLIRAGLAKDFFAGA
jgi:pilus assembly protein CpaF